MHKTFLKIFIPLLILSLFTIPHGFILAEDTDPQITNVTPSEIRFGDGQDLIIEGNNFNANNASIPGGLEINGIGIRTDGDAVWSDTQIRVLHETIEQHLYNVDKITDIKLQIYYPDENRWTYPTKDVSINLLPKCDADMWTCTDFGLCQQNGTKTRTCTKTFDCPSVITASPEVSQACVPECTTDSWSCGDWGACSSNGIKSRTCTKISNCEGGTQSPATTQSCSYTPPCSSDTWQCGNWGTCSPQGIQTRSCNRTFDCPSAETATPVTSQYCTPPNFDKYQVSPVDQQVINQNNIIKATVNLLCPLNEKRWNVGSGTVVDSQGTILTNKHVIENTQGCLVGFVNSYKDEPYFGDRHIADIVKISADADIAILKLRNPYNKNLIHINILNGNSNILEPLDKISTYGYPTKFGSKITSTRGEFSGVEGDFLKTTAIIDKGNSGGGAYLQDGTFIGIPTKVFSGTFNVLGGILSVNKVKSWLANAPIAYTDKSYNKYSRVSSILEDIDLSTLNSLDLYIADNKTETQKVIEQEKSLITKIDNNLAKRVSGNILLQVEKNGEGWYVNPDNKKKYYLGKPADAFSIMRNLGLGIKHAELENYLNSKFPSRLSGKIMLDVEQKGEAYYINPKDLKGYFLNKPSDAFKVMRNLGLGITNMDIRKIEVGEVE